MAFADGKDREIRNVEDLKKAMTSGEAFLFINTMDEHTIVIMEFPGELVDMQAGNTDSSAKGGTDGSRSD